MERGKLFSMGIAAVILLICPFTEPQAPPANNSSQPAGGELPPPLYLPNYTSNGSAQDNTEQQWALINKANVEKACVKVAKDEAEYQGYSRGLVFGCSCSGNEGAETKSYSCSISALDGSHPAGMECTKSLRSCAVTSEKGTYTYTFEQMQEMANS